MELVLKEIRGYSTDERNRYKRIPYVCLGQQQPFISLAGEWLVSARSGQSIAERISRCPLTRKALFEAVCCGSVLQHRLGEINVG